MRRDITSYRVPWYLLSRSSTFFSGWLDKKLTRFSLKTWESLKNLYNMMCML
jgi:hypothetical protein